MTTQTISRLTTKDRVKRLAAVVEQAPGNHYFNILIAQVDPDAMGSAFGIAAILQAMGRETAIWFGGGISHPQNRVLKNRFNLGAEMRHISKFSPIMADPVEGERPLASRENNFVLVDSNRGSDSRLPYAIEPLIVIDHHKDSDLTSPESLDYFMEHGFLWLDESAGSASTMVAELLEICFVRDSEETLLPDDVMTSISIAFNEKLATLLALGIYTDTKNMIAGGARDHRAFNFVRDRTNEVTLTQIIEYPLEESNFRNWTTALTNRQHHNAHLLSGMGIIDDYNADDLSTMADLLLRKEGVSTAIVWGGVRFVDDETEEETIKLRVCARSRTLTMDLAEFLRKRFKGKCGAKQLPDGRSEGGAMFELEHDGWLKPEDMLEVVNRRLKEWLFDEISSEASV